jgi:hypothetical protein
MASFYTGQFQNNIAKSNKYLAKSPIAWYGLMGKEAR